MNFDLVKNNKAINNALKERFKELDLTYQAVSNDSLNFSIKGINRSSLSRYFSNNIKGSLTHEQVVWLCVRYCIELKMKIKVMPYVEAIGKDNVKLLLGTKEKNK